MRSRQTRSWIGSVVPGQHRGGRTVMWSKRLVGLVVVLAAMMYAPGAGAAPKAMSLGPPFDQPYTETEGPATVDECTADESGHFVASVTSLGGTQSRWNVCRAGAYMEFANHRTGRTLTVKWHVTEAFGLDDSVKDPRDITGLYPNGPGLCVVLYPVGIQGCEPLGRVENLDRVYVFDLGDPSPNWGNVQVWLWAQACVCGDEAVVPQTARIDAQLQSVTVQ
jgi:hypothetical protein